MFKNLDENEFIRTLNTCEEITTNTSKILAERYGFNEIISRYLTEYYSKKFTSIIKRYELNGSKFLKKLDQIFDKTNTIPNNSCDLDLYFHKVLYEEKELNRIAIFKKKRGLHPINNFIRYVKFIFFIKTGVYKNKNAHGFTDIDYLFLNYLKIKSDLIEFKCFEWIPLKRKISTEQNFLKSIDVDFCADPIVNKFAKKYYFKFIPISIIQSLKMFRKLKKIDFKSFNTCSQIYNDFYNLILFIHSSQNKVCRVGQHGIDYGLKKNLKHYNKTKEERSKNIRFYYWWLTLPNTNETVHGEYFGRLFFPNKDYNNNILIIMPLPPFDYLSEDPNSFIKFKKDLLELSTKKRKSNIFVKLHNNSFDYDLDEFFLDDLKKNNITILEKVNMNSKFLSNFKIIIYGYLSTGFFESLLSGIKTICVDIYHESSNWRSNMLINELKSLGLIYYKLPKDFDFLNEHYPNFKLINKSLSKYVKQKINYEKN